MAREAVLSGALVTVLQAVPSNAAAAAAIPLTQPFIVILPLRSLLIAGTRAAGYSVSTNALRF
jgi:hypothetical protein